MTRSDHPGGASSRTRHEGGLARLARVCARHRWRTIIVWIVAAIAIIFSAQTFGGQLVDEFTIPNSDAQRATDLLEERFPSRSGDDATLVFAAPEGESLTGDRRQAVEAGLAAAREVPGVLEVGDPFEDVAGAVSQDGRIAFADAQFDLASFDVPKEDVEELESSVSAAVQAAGADVEVEYTGPVIINSETPEPGAAEIIGLIAAVIILLFMLGGAVAAGLPIVMALISVFLGLSLLFVAAGFTNFNTITPTLAVMLGLGVGIDYSLFILTRFRQAIHDGMGAEDAAAAAASTAGRAVVFAGVTVAISISALAVIGLDFITKLGFGAAITVVTSVIAAITLLPAILSLLGPRIDALRIPWLDRDDSFASRQRSPIARWGRFVTRHAAVVATATIVLLGVLALPVLWVQLGASDAGTNPPDTTTRKAYDLLAEGFGAGFNGPLLVTVDQGADTGAAERLRTQLEAVEGVAAVPPPISNEAGDTAIVTVFPTTSPQSAATRDLVEELRSDVIPGALEGTQTVAYVGGPTAAFDDIAAQIQDRLPYFLLAVIGITFIILSMAFRSVVVAIKASITTLMSAFAAFGVLIAVFQFGWGNEFVGLDTTGPIETFLPPIVFAILFGLSMDYEVFLVSRMREEYVHGAPAKQAVTDGIAAIGRVVVAAALIMTSVFLAFILGDDRVIKEFGLALGVAILIDAFIVRLALVPAIMYLLGERAWYMPRWLDRILPRITIEAPSSDERPAADAPRDPVAP